MWIGKLEHATKVNAFCLPPVVISLVGLAALSRKKGGTMWPAARSHPASSGRCTAPHDAGQVA